MKDLQKRLEALAGETGNTPSMRVWCAQWTWHAQLTGQGCTSTYTGEGTSLETAIEDMFAKVAMYLPD